MSNAEMPPLAAGQVWVSSDGDIVVLLGRLLDDGSRERYIALQNEGREASTALATLHDDHYIPSMKKNRYRLIHGPGAPWSPAEEVPHA